jgi:hypothetical protein
MQVRLAWLQLFASLVGWPATTIPASPLHVDEPFVILCLSWWAVLITALAHLSASQANVQVSKDD